MIKFTCTCGEPLRVKDELAGRRVRCPACRQAIEVPPTPVSRAPGRMGPPAGESKGGRGAASGPQA